MDFMADLEYQAAHLHEDQRPMIRAVVMALAVLGTVAVVLRLLSRRIMKAPLLADDYVTITGLVLAYGLVIDCYIATHHGIGQHILKAGFSQLKPLFKFIFAYQVLYVTSTFVVKMAVLLLYRRIFSTARFKKAINYVIVFNLAAFLGFFLAVFLQCVPVQNAWLNPDHPRCIERVPFFKAAGYFSLITDVVVLMMPMFVVWKLNTSRQRKVAMTGMFLLGGFVCVAAILRLPYLTSVTFKTDPTWRIAPAMMWSNIESCMGIVCACLPTLRPLIRVAISEPIENLKRKRRSRQGQSRNSASSSRSRTSFWRTFLPWRKSNSSGDAGACLEKQSLEPSCMSEESGASGHNPVDGISQPPSHPPPPAPALVRPGQERDLEAQQYVLGSIRRHSTIDWRDDEGWYRS